MANPTPEEIEQSGFPKQAEEERQRQAAPPPVPPGTPAHLVDEERSLREAYPTMFNPDGTAKF